MKNPFYKFLLIALTLFVFDYSLAQPDTAVLIRAYTFTEKVEIHKIGTLIQNMYIWHESNNPSEIDMITGDSLYTGFNLDDLATNLEELR